MKKIIVSILVVFGIVFTGYGIYINLTGSFDNSDAGGNANDTWSFGGNYIYSNPNASTGGIIAKISGKINSNLFGTFQFGTGGIAPIKFIKSTNNTLCGAGNTVFDIKGIINSSTGIWPDMSFTGGSYYCPGTNSWSGTVYSKITGYKHMGNIVAQNTNTIQGAGLGSIFNKDSLVVQGLIGKGKNNTINIGKILNTANNNTQETLFIDSLVSRSKLDLLVNKNISLLTRGLNANNSNTQKISNLLSVGKKIYYYNFEGNPSVNSSNENNKGKILEISNGNYNLSSMSNYQVGVSGEKTIIVKGGNIYINADIYNKDPNSILTLVVKRDSTNNTNGGNIYINPNVTNIDAVLIADGSVINYNGISVVTNSGSLMKQILIYGSLFTKNSIGGQYSPYGSDGYIQYGKNKSTGAVKYDLTKLRHFTIGLSSDTDTVCNSPLNYIVPQKSLTSTGAMEFAWAGKRKCYNELLRSTPDSLVANLRGSNKFNSVIIKYNPLITNNPPFILRNN